MKKEGLSVDNNVLYGIHFEMENIEPQDKSEVKKSEVKEGYWDSLLDGINKNINAREDFQIASFTNEGFNYNENDFHG